MKTEILSCGYSYHIVPFTMGGRKPLSTYLFRLQTEGDCHAYVKGRMTPVHAGDLLLFKPNDLYELRIEAGISGKVNSGDYYMVCQGEWMDEWWKRTTRPTRVRIGMDDRILSMWKQLVLEKRRVGERDSELNGYLLQSLCLYLDRALEETVTDPKQSFMAFRMKRFVEEQAPNTFTVKEVASQIGLSASRGAHLFKESFGESIMQYALKVRLSMAVERIKYSSLTLDQIADSCGLGSYPYFHRVFKERIGVTPSVYRQRWNKEAEGGG